MKIQLLHPSFSFVVLTLLLVEQVTCEQYYIVSSPNTPCPNATDACMTLNQYAANASQYYHMNTSLILQQGIHSLNTELSISNVTEISISAKQPVIK